MSDTTTLNQNPMSEHLGLPSGVNPQAYGDYLRALAQQQANTTGLTQMGPNTGGATGPTSRQYQTDRPMSAGRFGPGEGAARKRESMQNLVTSAKNIASTFAQKAKEKQQREYTTTITRYTGAVQGVQQAQAQVQQGQQMLNQAAQLLKANPNDPQARELVQQGQQLSQAGRSALQQNQTILNDMSQDKKAHKVITKAFGIDDKNANSPERQAAIQALQKQMGIGGPAAGILSQLPQNQQLSPQAQQQQMARQAGIVGAPASQGQILSAQTQMAKTEATESGKNLRADAKDKLTAAFKGMKYDDKGNLAPMTQEEIAKNPVLSSKMATDHARQDLMAAQTEVAKARAIGIPEQIKLAEGKLAIAQGNLGMRQKEFGLKVEAEARKRFETEMKMGGPQNVSTSGGSQDISSITGGRPLESWAQRQIGETMPVFDQISALKSKIESLGLKDNDTAGYLFLPRLAYAAGFGGEQGKMSQEISSLELSKVIGAARVLKGSSRALPALDKAMIHLPYAWKDSPKKMYQQLENIETNLKNLNQEALAYGQKYQNSRDIENRLRSQGALPGDNKKKVASPSAPSSPSSADPLGVLK